MLNLGIYGKYLVKEGMADTRAVRLEEGLRDVLSALNACDDNNMSIFKNREPELYEGLARYATIQMERVPEL